MFPEIEYSSKLEIKQFQEKELKKILKYTNQYSEYYKQYFQLNKIDVAKISTIEDLSFIEPTTKELLQENNDMFICNNKNIIDYLTTSGTSGEPVVIGLTENDLQRLAYNEYISFLCAGIEPVDIVQLMVTLDKRFMAGLAYYMGLRKLGTGIIRVGSANPELQWDTIKRIQPNVLIGVPSLIYKLIEFAENNGINCNSSFIKKAVCIGDSIRNIDFTYNSLGRKITEKWDIKLYSTYASTEMAAAFTECSEHRGGHHHPELLIIELLDENNNPVKEGETGELTITTLGTEGTPLLRFKTGDICFFESDRCACGRNTIRISPIIGRKNQMIKYKGTTLYPPSLYNILDDMQDIDNYIVEVYTNDFGTDEILIFVGTDKDEREIILKLKEYFQAKLRVTPEIKVLPTAIILKKQYSELSRKPVKFIDRR